MIPSLISRQQLEIINRKTIRYPLQTAEKDYFLAVVMQIIAESDIGDKVVFKGGTAIHHCYLDQLRFSEDLDFSALKNHISLEHVKSIFEVYPFLSIKEEFDSYATIKIGKLQFTGPLNHPNILKVEIDRLQNVLLTPHEVNYDNIWGLEFMVNVMDVREICAEKIRAMSDRARYRDFYDLYWLIHRYELELSEIISLIPQKEIRRPITKASILRNWEVVIPQKANEMRQIFYSQPVDGSLIQNMIDSLPFTKIST